MTARIKTARARRAYTTADWNAVSDNPEWTAEEMAKAKPFAEVFPELAANARRVRGKQKAPTKQLVSLRLDRSVVEAFKAEGTGWQSRMNEALKQAAQNRQPVVPGGPGLATDRSSAAPRKDGKILDARARAGPPAVA